MTPVGRRAAGLALALDARGRRAAGSAQPATQPAAPAVASAFLFINQEDLLTGSKQGQALLAEEDRQRDTLRTEARKLDASFEDGGEAS